MGKLDKGSCHICLGKDIFKHIYWSVRKQANRTVNTR